MEYPTSGCIVRSINNHPYHKPGWLMLELAGETSASKDSDLPMSGPPWAPKRVPSLAYVRTECTLVEVVEQSRIHPAAGNLHDVKRAVRTTRKGGSEMLFES